jgi:hypothetical protein
VITLVTPKATENIFLFWQNACFGPYDSLYKSDGEKIPFSSKLEAMEETKGIYGENNVVHDKLIGEFRYEPLIGGMVPAPTALAPYRVAFPTYNPYDLKQPTTSYSDYGLAIDGETSIRKAGTQGFHTGWIRDPQDPSKWTAFEVIVFLSTPTRVTNFYEYRMKSIQYWTKEQVYVHFERRTYDTFQAGIFTSLDWTVKQPLDSVLGLRSQAGRVTVTQTQQLAAWRKVRTTPSLSPTDAREKIDALVAQLGLKENFPIPDKHYGDLAMEASQQVNANSTNMIAFLKDLRKPKELIPKLQKLRSLKGAADNYLTVNYGILPTIDDIKTIVGAFKARKPYFDKNGFKTYSAGFSDELTKDGLSHSLTQRIKLAISDEDDEFEALLERLESMGTLPTFENLWDLVPYSFVIDWFVDVGGLLERVDSRLRLTRLNIRYVTMSRKTSSKGKSKGTVETPFIGTIDWVHYHRWVSDQCPVPPLSLQTTFQDFDHWLESGALLAQRSKH